MLPRLVMPLLFVGFAAIASAARARADTVQERYDRETERFAAALSDLAQTANDSLLRDELQSWQVPRAPDRQTLFLPPYLTHDPAADPSRQVSPLVTELLDDHAARLWQIAQQALKEGQWQLAYRLAHEVAAFDPKHDEALRVIGKPRPTAGTNGSHVTMRRGSQPHPSLGWRAGRYWIAETDHFLIESNDSAAAVRTLADALEVVHAVWRQLFVDSWSTDGQIESLFRADALPPTWPQHRVILFRDQQQYRRALRNREPLIGMTLGLYRPSDQAMYLYSQPPDADGPSATWFHEATHQLFQELGPGRATVAEQANAWIVEGIGMYMESIQRFARVATVGGIDAPRLQFARYRCLTEGTHEPLERLAELGRAPLQARDDVRGLYSQAAGYTHFLMDGEGGALRSALIEYLRQVYAGTATATTFAELAGVPLTDLESQYRSSFLPLRDQQLDYPRASKSVKQLALGRCPITSVGARQLRLAPIETLTWLDLNHCDVDDDGLGWLERAGAMRQLSLEATHISDKTLLQVAKMLDLEELDLAGTATHDDVIEYITALPRLRVLWLTDTPITDQGLKSLARMKSLKQLDVTGTQVTAEALARFRKNRPSVRVSGP